MAAMLSHIMFGGVNLVIPISLRRLVSHIISTMDVSNALYSSEDLTTVFVSFTTKRLHHKKVPNMLMLMFYHQHYLPNMHVCRLGGLLWMVFEACCQN